MRWVGTKKKKVESSPISDIMKVTFLVCDLCGRGNDDGVKVKSYCINTDKEPDPSGNGYNIIWDYTDYCHDCHKKAVEKYGDDIKPL